MPTLKQVRLEAKVGKIAESISLSDTCHVLSHLAFELSILKPKSRKNGHNERVTKYRLRRRLKADANLTRSFRPLNEVAMNAWSQVSSIIRAIYPFRYARNARSKCHTFHFDSESTIEPLRVSQPHNSRGRTKWHRKVTTRNLNGIHIPIWISSMTS